VLGRWTQEAEAQSVRPLAAEGVGRKMLVPLGGQGLGVRMREGAPRPGVGRWARWIWKVIFNPQFLSIIKGVYGVGISCEKNQ